MATFAALGVLQTCDACDARVPNANVTNLLWLRASQPIWLPAKSHRGCDTAIVCPPRGASPPSGPSSCGWPRPKPPATIQCFVPSVRDSPRPSRATALDWRFVGTQGTVPDAHKTVPEAWAFVGTYFLFAARYVSGRPAHPKQSRHHDTCRVVPLPPGAGAGAGSVTCSVARVRAASSRPPPYAGAAPPRRAGGSRRHGVAPPHARSGGRAPAPCRSAPARAAPLP